MLTQYAYNTVGFFRIFGGKGSENMKNKYEELHIPSPLLEHDLAPLHSESELLTIRPLRHVRLFKPKTLYT